MAINFWNPIVLHWLFEKHIGNSSKMCPNKEFSIWHYLIQQGRFNFSHCI